MVVVGGTFQVDPDQREQFLAGRAAMMRASRAEPGNLEYAFCADPIDPSRVVLYERWATREDLDAHIAALRTTPPTIEPNVEAIASSIIIYDISGEHPLGR